MDVEALSLLHDRVNDLESLPDPSDPDVTYGKYTTVMTETMSQTKETVQEVASYAEKIGNELKNVREQFKMSSIKIGEQIKELMKNDLFKVHEEHGAKVRDLHSARDRNPQGSSQWVPRSARVRSQHDAKVSDRHSAQVSDRHDAPATQKNIDIKTWQQVQTMQKLAKQQQDLEQFIAKTEEILQKIEHNAEISLSDISECNKHLNKWCDGLETLEKRKKRIRDEKEKKERGKRQKEEAERRRKEKEENEKREKEETERRRKEKQEREKNEKEEAERRRKENQEREKREKEAERRRKEREAEEEKRRQEEEKKRRDWNNWPPFIYMNATKNKFNQDISCVVYTMPDEIKQSDLSCQASDAEYDLDHCLESNDEQVISSLITITPKNDKKITFQMPTRVYVPVVCHDQNLDTKLKFKINGNNKWSTGKSLPIIQLPGVWNVAFVGVEIPVKTLKCIECIAVARYKCDEIEVDVDGKIFEPEGDRNIKVKFRPKSFSGKTTVATKTVPWSNKNIKIASKKHKELENIKTAGSFIDISCEKLTKEDSDVEMYDLGWVGDENLQNHKSVVHETLSRSSRWMVNHMNPDDDTLSLDRVFDSDFIGTLKTVQTQGDKNRKILQKLHDSSDSDFEKFIDCLNDSQPNVASRVKNVKKQVQLSRDSNGTNSNEDDFANDFDSDFERKEGTVCFVSKLTGKSWEMVPIEALDDHPNARCVKLPAGNDRFQVLGLVVPAGKSDEDICRAAEILESLNCATNVSVICRQKHSNPQDVIIECVRSENVTETIYKLNEEGYIDGPAESAEFRVLDGEEITIEVEHNLILEGCSNSTLKMKFYTNITSDRYSGHLSVVNKGDQLDDDNFHGYLSYKVSSERLSEKRCGKMVLYIPKTLEDVVGNFPFTLDVPVKALAKFIAWQLTKDNFNSSRWVKYAGYLTDRDKHLYHQIVKHIDKEVPGASQRGRCELFILYWANHHAEFDTDKIEKMIAAHHDERLENEDNQFIKPYIPGKGLLSNDNLEKIAIAVAKDWENMAKKLGFLSDEINQIKSSQPGIFRQTLRMLDVWRLSNSAIQKGTDLVKSLHEAAKSAQCGAKLSSMISDHVQIENETVV